MAFFPVWVVLLVLLPGVLPAPTHCQGKQVCLSQEDRGVVLVFYGGAHQPVCDDSWDQVDADVACRQAGFMRGALTATTGNDTQGLTYIMDKVGCTGGEKDLLRCAQPTLSFLVMSLVPVLYVSNLQIQKILKRCVAGVRDITKLGSICSSVPPLCLRSRCPRVTRGKYRVTLWNSLTRLKPLYWHTLSHAPCCIFIELTLNYVFNSLDVDHCETLAIFRPLNMPVILLQPKSNYMRILSHIKCFVKQAICHTLLFTKRTNLT